MHTKIREIRRGTGVFVLIGPALRYSDLRLLAQPVISRAFLHVLLEAVAREFPQTWKDDEMENARLSSDFH